LASLRKSVAAGFVVVWISGFLLGVFFNGGLTHLPNRASTIIVAATFVGASTFALLVALSRRVQNIVLAESRRGDFRRGDFLFIASVNGALALIVLVAVNAFISSVQAA
jgi:hypothetical protein